MLIKNPLYFAALPINPTGWNEFFIRTIYNSSIIFKGVYLSLLLLALIKGAEQEAAEKLAFVTWGKNNQAETYRSIFSQFGPFE